MDDKSILRIGALEQTVRALRADIEQHSARLRHFEAQHAVMLRTLYRGAQLLTEAKDEAQRLRIRHNLPLYKGGIPQSEDEG